MNKGRSVVSLVLCVLLSAASVVCGKGILELLVSSMVDSWLSDRPVIYVSQLTDNQKSELVATLRDYSASHEIMVLSQSKASLQSGSTLYTFSILGSSSAKDVSFDALSILGTAILDKADALAVLAADGEDAYMGYGDDAAVCIASLPSIRSGVQFRLERITSADNIGTSCRVIGLNDDEFQELLEILASQTGSSIETLTTKMSGSSTEVGLTYLFCGGAFAILAVAYCLFMVSCSLLRLKDLGVYMMLGWSRRDYARHLFSAQMKQLAAVVPVCLLGLLLTFDGFECNPSMFAYGIAISAPAVFVILLSVGVASLPVATSKPVDAIFDRYPKSGFYVLTVAAYLMCLCLVFYGCLYIDQPIDMYKNSIQTLSAWDKNADWYVIQDFTLEDGNRYTGNTMELSEDMYQWYAEHEHDEGVYLAKTEYFSASVIQAYSSADTNLEPFWYLAASPSYLEEIGIDVSEEDIQKAESGVRVYLVPSTLSAAETEELEQLLIAARRPYESDIVTEFMQNPQYGFSTYDGTRQLFTWSVDADEPISSDNVVIAVITSSNMVAFESESLVASGLEGSYIKLSDKASTALLTAGKATLGECAVAVRFTTVENYIDGTQKTLEELFALFSVVLAVMTASMVVVVACLIGVANRISAREIAVKHVLGFSLWEIYRTEAVFLSMSALAGIVVCALFSSNAGVLVGIALLVVSDLAALVASRAGSGKMILEIVSREQ